MYTKFDYKALTRETLQNERKYNIPNGIKVPSVTTILDKTKPLEAKMKLLEWKKRQGFEQAAKITAQASARGTKMHKFLEDYIMTGQMDESLIDDLSINSYEMAQIIVNNGLVKCNEFWGVEVGLYYQNMYAGTTDLICLHENKPCILDFKQANKPKKKEWIEDYFLQLTAYAEAHDFLFNTKIDKGVILMCTQDKMFQEFIIEGDEFEYYKDKWFDRVTEYYTQLL